VPWGDEQGVHKGRLLAKSSIVNASKAKSEEKADGVVVEEKKSKVKPMPPPAIPTPTH